MERVEKALGVLALCSAAAWGVFGVLMINRVTYDPWHLFAIWVACCLFGLAVLAAGEK